MTNVALNILTGIAIAAVSSWITVQLSLRRFRSEKWWEKRVEAYERVIEALHHAKAFSSAHLDAFEMGKGVSDKQNKELRANSKKAQLEIERATEIGGFIICEEAVQRLKQYQGEAKSAGNTQHWHEYVEADWVATNACLEGIIRIAKKDLRTK